MESSSTTKELSTAKRRAGRPKTHLPICNHCDTALVVPDNWSESERENSNYTCKPCNAAQSRERYWRKKGQKPRREPSRIELFAIYMAVAIIGAIVGSALMNAAIALAKAVF